MTTTSNKRSDHIAGDQKMIDGVQKFLSQLASLPVGSQNMTPADIVKVFQDRLTLGKTVQTAEAARATAVKADRDERARTAALVQSFRRIVQGMFAQSPDTLAVFGLTPLKVAKKKVDVKAAAVVKSKATRKARNTVGKKAKLLIKGAPPANKLAPTTPPETPAKPNA
ncbi:MAG: hypothetical protein M3O46_13935 [Myxococcota bacterium]|nr:hypothetical protein [Myxococcota bacterium]